MPLDCNDGAALRVAPVKGPDPKLWNEFCRQVSPSQVRDASGTHDGNEHTRQAIASGGVHQRNNVVHQVSSAASHPALRDAILPGRSEGSSLGNHPRGFHRGDHLEPELLIAIKDQVFVRLSTRKISAEADFGRSFRVVAGPRLCVSPRVLRHKASLR
jgi:hypothetical protein